MQGTGSEASQADGSDSELNELSDGSEDAMLDAWQEMGSIIGEVDSMADDNIRGQHHTEILSDVNGILEADILLPTCTMDVENQDLNLRSSKRDEAAGNSTGYPGSWLSAANSVLQGPAGELELQQIIEKCENPSQFEALLDNYSDCSKVWLTIPT